ncbi:MAG: hypothetical protein ACOCYG_07745 [Spirochaetota bacterium]
MGAAAPLPWKTLVSVGLLVDVSRIASTVDFLTPIALSRSVWDQYIDSPTGAASIEQNVVNTVETLKLHLEATTERDEPQHLVYFHTVFEHLAGMQRVGLFALIEQDENDHPVATVFRPQDMRTLEQM